MPLVFNNLDFLTDSSENCYLSDNNIMSVILICGSDAMFFVHLPNFILLESATMKRLVFVHDVNEKHLDFGVALYLL